MSEAFPELTDAETSIRLLLEGRPWIDEHQNGMVLPRRRSQPIKISYDLGQPAGTVSYCEGKIDIDPRPFLVTWQVESDVDQHRTYYAWNPNDLELPHVFETTRTRVGRHLSDAKDLKGGPLEDRIEEVYFLLELTAGALQKQRLARRSARRG